MSKDIMDIKIDNTNEKSEFHVELFQEKENVSVYNVFFKSLMPCVPSKITVEFHIPYVEAFSLWNAQCGTVRNVLPDWRPEHQIAKSRIASGIPIQSVISQDGNNVFTISVQDAKTPIEISCGTESVHQTCLCRITFFVRPVGRISEYESKIVIDQRRRPFYEVIENAAEEMRNGEQVIPQGARLPVYSTWYNFHQDVNDEELIEECKKAFELGMRNIIVDDGWQTENNDGGYAYCGDWNVCKRKIKDMRCFVHTIHKIGMKVILWYSVPFVGKKADAWKLFKGKYLDNEEKEWNCLDPRFPEVREYLVDIYEKAVREWGIDGLKLDFLDAFELTPYSDKNGIGRDYESLEDAIERLLSEINLRLKAINPDILLEFRQSYIGPVITQFGNMLRVGDCALDAFMNRMGILDLRMTSGKVAVHSDMIVWSDQETNESVAKQLIAILFGVPQISVNIANLSKEHYRVLKFWLSFWLDHREILLDGKLSLYNPETNYSMAEAERNGEKICICYSRNIVTYSGRRLTVINGSGETDIVIKGEGKFMYTILDCQGTELESGAKNIKNVADFLVPQSGMLKLEAL